MDLGTKNAGKHLAIIIAGFPAIGKTRFASDAKLQTSIDLDVVDLDSSAYSKEPGFPENYLHDIRKAAEKPCIILISTHVGLPTQLAKEGYYVAIVYPGSGMDAKQEWLARLERRDKAGKSSRLYKMMDEHWTLWFGQTATEQASRRWTLSNKAYLSDVFGSIYADFQAFRMWSRRQDYGH